jgi:hypothetical protein
MIQKPKNTITRYIRPNNIKHAYKEEEKALRACGDIVSSYIDFVKSRHSGIPQKYRYIRDLYMFMKRTTQPLFTQAIQRALTYKVNSIHQISGIFTNILKKPLYETPSTHHTSEYMNREEYIKGRFCSENDLFISTEQ